MVDEGKSHPQHATVRPDWLASYTEEVIDPGQALIDAHHHFYDRPGARYLLHDMLDDIASGHDLRATVFVQARAMYRASGPEEMKPVGETEFANGVAAMSASSGYGPTRFCAGIIGSADLMSGDAVQPVLEAHVAAAPARFRGIRHTAAWDRDTSLLNPAYTVSEEMLDTPAFRAGFAHLAPLGLSFDAWLFFHQLPRLADLARSFPQTAIVLDHCGGVLGIGPYLGKGDEVFARWLAGMRELADCSNLSVKLGGLGMRMCGFGFDARSRPASSRDLAEAWQPWMETAIELFGAGRCMFESNFPVDKGSYGHVVGWNALKRVAAGASQDERDDLCWRSAARFYRLDAVETGRRAERWVSTNAGQ
ncbi:amidohydrolase family protein [Sphingomonas sp. CL5.1]|uniref:amidohydrolase family protein n=1 Tax=Sphingomonas sp. CL5.1 TaxID=2653203 RepID=UPI0015843B62|nr:amidohydrolase family protein [Sphingomonas sp. CL5.1]QKS00622.1 amidohydrolase family protein [Sphingomonas sp. CL5.1]